MVLGTQLSVGDQRLHASGPRRVAGPSQEPPRRRAGIVSTLLAAAAFGLLLAVVPTEERRLSIDLWMVGVAAYAAFGLGRRALGTVPSEPGGFRFPLRIHPAGDPDDTLVPRGVATLEGGILAAADNARSYDHRLRPRLRAVAAHQLRIHHGIDLDDRPERAAEALGDVAWLVDDTAAERPPTAAEMNLLLDRLAVDGGTGTERPADDERNR